MNHFTVKSLIVKHRTLWANKLFAISAITGLLFFFGSLVINYGAMRYATKEEGSATTDILLDNLPVINTDIVFSEGAALFVILIVFLLILKPKAIPFTLKSVALFICVRSVFLIMTHLAPFPDHISPDLDHLRYISSGSDLFFSGHTGLPFLMALLFWENRRLKWFFLFCSVVAAASAILGHLHYTIDIFSAFFITYGIYHIAQKAFPKDLKLLKSGPEANSEATG